MYYRFIWNKLFKITASTDQHKKNVLLFVKGFSQYIRSSI